MISIFAMFTSGPFTSQKDYFQRISDFIHKVCEYFETGLSNLDQIPEIMTKIHEWIHQAFSFIPQYFVVIFTWFIIAAMIVRFLRW